jgi:hypothetical protein
VSTWQRDAAERTSVQGFVERVGLTYGAQSVLEGPVDGSNGEVGGHSHRLAARGVAVTVAISRANDEAIVLAGYARAGLGAPTIRYIPEPLAAGALPQADLVVSFDAPASVHAWQDYLTALAHCARKALVVVVRNPDRPLNGASHPGCATHVLGQVLWKVGRVREHAYLGVPRWVLALPGGRAQSFDEGIAQGPAGRAVRLAAPLHAFVVDTSPRTPQARRRLGLAAAS